MNSIPSSQNPPESGGQSPVEMPPATDEASSNVNVLKGPLLLVALTAVYVLLQILALNFYPLEAWTQRILHMVGGLALGAILYSSTSRGQPHEPGWLKAIGALSLLLAISTSIAFFLIDKAALDVPGMNFFSWAMALSIIVTIPATWVSTGKGLHRLPDISMAMLSLVIGWYLISYLDMLQFRAGAFPTTTDAVVAASAIAILLEITRRTTGMAMVIIASIFILYAFVGPWMPSILYHEGYNLPRVITYLITDNGILGPTLGVSATYLILFIVFAAFLQSSGAGDYFVRLAFAVAGHKRGGPAKVSVLASGLMGTINGSSAGNVVSTGAFTIPLMKKVGYKPPVSGAIEAAASSGGQILPPIMGAGAFIMADITGIPYTEIVLAATIPGILYFLSVYFMVDLEAAKMAMRGLSKDQLPDKAKLLKQLYLLSPIIILILCLISGYSVIRAGTLSGISVIAVSWFGATPMGPKRIFYALALAGQMAIPLIAVCATAGIVVGVISITGVGLRFSSILLSFADASLLLALVFAMLISIVLGMGMPTTAAYAVAAAVIAPGLVQLGLEPIISHFFVFFFAVMSAITPPVALAAYAGAAIAGANSMTTGVQAFKIGIAAFLIPFIFCFNPALLMQGTVPEIAMAAFTATIGIYFLSAAVQGWLITRLAIPVRILAFSTSMLMIMGGWETDLAGIALALAIIFWKKQETRNNPLISETKQ
ncbi:TRAP transporter fused permease subunit [Halomonas daqingensis]|uniref:TRAP transporter fused permease subunit n=1 Tax=Billgrantia desiderata TaxID=52021 RepID=A0ABS9B9K2_9GAMM|nr:TRAP transporter fused permease subunit [Halomonas desiderata]MCE8043979.1 TRAP transporter fused permease subunit [Halomonas desiderata]MCE8048553.1 TRAP transporter fused permease subunit [Halomonas desiderata]